MNLIQNFISKKIQKNTNLFPIFSPEKLVVYCIISEDLKHTRIKQGKYPEKYHSQLMP